MRVEEWMSMELLTVKPRDSVAHARALLEEHRINQLPVTVNGRLVGIVTDRDLRDAVNTQRVAAAEATGKRPVTLSPDAISVESAMTAKALTIRPGDTMEKAAALMRRERIGALPVLEGRSLRGIVTRSDVLEAFLALAAAPAKAKKGKTGNARKGPHPKPQSGRHVRR